MTCDCNHSVHLPYRCVGLVTRPYYGGDADDQPCRCDIGIADETTALRAMLTLADRVGREGYAALGTRQDALDSIASQLRDLLARAPVEVAK